MFKKCCCVVVFSLFIQCIPVKDSTDKAYIQVSSRVLLDRVVIKFRPGVPDQAQASVVAGNGHRTDRTIPQLHMHVVPVPPGRTAEQVIARYEKHPLVEYAEAETFAEPQLTPNDPWFANWQKPLQMLSAEAAWDITTGSPQVPIGVLDTGLDTNHFEFVDRIARGEIYGYDFKDDDPDFDDPAGHGTAVGGIIAALANNGAGIAGASWHNPVAVLRTGFGLDVIEAVTWATDNGVRVISMSYGTTIDMSWQRDVMQYAFDRGVVLVGAAANGYTPAFYPAAYPTVLAVTGVDSYGEPVGYNYGDWIDLSAPMGLTTVRQEDDGNGDGVGFVGGTSISTPFVAAAAGLVLSVNPDLTPTQVMDILRDTADDVYDPGFDVMTGYGRVNYFAAVQAAQDTEPPAPDTTPPTAAVTSPNQGDILTGTVTVSVEASDNVGVTRVDLYVDGEFVSSDSSPPHEWPLDTTGLTDGEHSLTAIANDAAGNTGESPSVTVEVDNDLPDPPVLQTEVLDGRVHKKADATFVVDISNPGSMTTSISFGGGPRALLSYTVVSSMGEVLTAVTGSSPLMLSPVIVEPGAYVVRVGYVNRNVSFTAIVIHP